MVCGQFSHNLKQNKPWDTRGQLAYAQYIGIIEREPIVRFCTKGSPPPLQAGEDVTSYFDNTKLDKKIDWKSIYYANNGRLEWLEFNIKRSLMIECDSQEEQEIGINEVKETIEHVVYYDKVKNEILKNINNLIK